MLVCLCWQIKGSCVRHCALLEPPVFLQFEGNFIAKFNVPLSLRYSGPKKDGFKYKLMACLYHSGGHFTACLCWPDSNRTFEYDGMRHQGLSFIRLENLSSSWLGYSSKQQVWFIFSKVVSQNKKTLPNRDILSFKASRHLIWQAWCGADPPI